MTEKDSIVTFSEMPMGKIKHIHFVGIGGSGMSGIAEVIHYLFSGCHTLESVELFLGNFLTLFEYPYF